MGARERGDELVQRIGARLYKFRRRRKLSALRLAVAVGVHRNTIWRIEAGLAACNVVDLVKIAEVLGVEIGDFVNVAPSVVHRGCEEQKSC